MGTATATRKPRRKMSATRTQELDQRKAAIEEAAEHVDQEAPDFRAFLARWGDRYNINNLIRLWVQAPSATVLHKYGTWQKMGRQVRKGQAAILLMQPRTGTDPEKATPDNPDGRVFFGASWMALFDISQTDLIDGFTGEQADTPEAQELAARIEQLKAEAVALHPDRGGDAAEFMKAWAKVEAARDRLREMTSR